MYAIRSKKTNRWFRGINTQAGQNSSLRIIMDESLPILFKTKELARVEALTNHLSLQTYEILEVDVVIQQHAI